MVTPTDLGYLSTLEALMDKITETAQARALGTCPVCSGTSRETYTGSYGHVIAGFDPDTNTLPCQNCGGQYMFSRATGNVPLNSAGEPCAHDYSETGPEERRMYGQHEYTCAHCGDRFLIDSGD